jgi:hypothetical protein
MWLKLYLRECWHYWNDIWIFLDLFLFWIIFIFSLINFRCLNSWLSFKSSLIKFWYWVFNLFLIFIYIFLILVVLIFWVHFNICFSPIILQERVRCANKCLILCRWVLIFRIEHFYLFGLVDIYDLIIYFFSLLAIWWGQILVLELWNSGVWSELSFLVANRLDLGVCDGLLFIWALWLYMFWYSWILWGTFCYLILWYSWIFLCTQSISSLIISFQITSLGLSFIGVLI